MECWHLPRGRMARPDTPQPLTLFEAVVPVAALILLVGLSYYLFGDAGALGPNQVAPAVATMMAVFNFASPLLAIAVTATGVRLLHAAPQAGGPEPSTPLAGGG